MIRTLSAIGIITSTILRFNGPERLIERHILRGVGRYPSPAAIHRVTAS